jgi:hypothetical protein
MLRNKRSQNQVSTQCLFFFFLTTKPYRKQNKTKQIISTIPNQLIVEK